MKIFRTIFLATLALMLAAPAFAGAYEDNYRQGTALAKEKKFNEALGFYEKALDAKPNAKLKAYVDKLKAAGYKAPAAAAAGSSSGGKGKVAIVVSEYTKAWMDGKGKNPENIDVAGEGAAIALKKLGYSFDKISDKDVEAGKLLSGGYDIAVLPDSGAMSNAEAKALEKFQAAGKGILAVWGYGGFDEDGLDQMDLETLNGIFGVNFTGWQGDPNVGMGAFNQYFWMTKKDKSHAVGQGLPDRIMVVTGEANTVDLNGAKSVYGFMDRDKKTETGGSAVTAFDPGSGKGRTVFIGTYMCSQIAGDDPDIPKALLIRLTGNALKWLEG